jgi:CheY-like chemotaxis protein
VDKLNIDLDEPFLKKFFGLTEKVLPEGQEITLSMLRRQLDEIDNALGEAKLTAQQEKPGYTPPSRPSLAANSFGETFTDDDGFNLPKKTILIIDDLGVITYQLSVLFKQANFEVITSKEIYDAIEKFKKQSFDLVIMDLFIPTEREGFILLEELKKIALANQKLTKIGVMSASGKKEHKQSCKMKGAEFYVEKIDDWKKELFGIINQLK